jgi:hypothetical protein
MFRKYVAKVDQDVVYVAMVVHVCCKLMFQCFICFSDVCYKYFYLDVAYVSHICCKCFIWMLLMFYNGFEVFFKCFRCMFQVFHLS